MYEIENYFNGLQVFKLKENPKIFIYDCCRGRERSNLIENRNIVYKSGLNTTNNPGLTHKDNNYTKIYATTKEHKVSDRPKLGSFLTQSIAKIFLTQNEKYTKYRENIHNIRLYDMFQKIKCETENSCGNWQCMEYVSTAKYPIFFKKQNINSNT